MAFPKRLLNHNEELVLDLRPHWIFLAPSTLTLVVVGILTLMGTLAWNPGGLAETVLQWALGLAFLAALAWWGITYAKWTTTNFVLTSDRIVTRRGVLAKSGVEIPLDRINTVFFQQNLFERMVGAGDLAIESAGERGTETFEDIRKPSIVQKEIYVQMEANEGRKYERMHRAATGGGAGSADATTPMPPGIPEQIEQLSELHQRGVLSDAEFARKKAELLDRM